MAIVGRDAKMATFARGPQSGSTGVEEQGELVECDRVLALRVPGHRASLEWNQDRRWLTGRPDGADGAVVAISVKMRW